MLVDNYELIETIVLNIGLLGLFLLMGYAIHDVLTKNNVPLIGRAVAYGVMFLGALGFLAKGIIQIFFTSNGIGS
jgi:quinol-cytochrome oxidoreductase complex cytochrome b subunit